VGTGIRATISTKHSSASVASAGDRTWKRDAVLREEGVITGEVMFFWEDVARRVEWDRQKGSQHDHKVEPESGMELKEALVHVSCIRSLHKLFSGKTGRGGDVEEKKGNRRSGVHLPSLRRRGI